MSALVRFNTKWDRGADLQMYFQYAVGTTEANAVAPSDFVTWSARADAQQVEAGTQVQETSPLVSITSPDGISLGADGSVIATFAKENVLPGGVVDALFSNENPIVLKYDLMLRDPNGRQFKLAAGTIVVEDSVTVWPTA